MSELLERIAVLEGRVNELSQTQRRFDLLEQQIFLLGEKIDRVEESLRREMNEFRHAFSQLQQEFPQLRKEVYQELNSVREDLGRRIDKYFGWLVVIIVALCVNLAAVSYQIWLQISKGL